MKTNPINDMHYNKKWHIIFHHFNSLREKSYYANFESFNEKNILKSIIFILKEMYILFLTYIWGLKNIEFKYNITKYTNRIIFEKLSTYWGYDTKYWVSPVIVSYSWFIRNMGQALKINQLINKLDELFYL